MTATTTANLTAMTALAEIKARNATARRAAIAAIRTYHSATLGRRVTIHTT